MLCACTALAAILTATGVAAAAQDPTPSPKPEAASIYSNPRNVDPRPVKTFQLKNVSDQNDANEILVALRNILEPDVKIYMDTGRDLIAMRGSEQQLELAHRLIDELDQPRKSYRLTYTISQTEGGKRVSSEHYTMVLASGQNTTLKAGDKVPVVTGSLNSTAGATTQNTYLDVGMNFDATLTTMGDGAQLKSKFEQSSIAEEKSGMGPQDPMVQQDVLAGVAYLSPGKPLVLGSLDIAGTTRKLEIEVEMEPVP
jgi:type II secretory pathway component GspD/PulD (secretin)